MTTNSVLISNRPFTPHQLLIVEDDEKFRRIVVECCKALKFKVFAAANPIEAIDLFATNTFDLVLTDHRMPHMTGVQLAKWIRQHYPDLPICIMSLDVENPQFSGEIREWADAAVAKPFSMGALDAALTKAVCSRNQKRVLLASK